MEFPAKVKRWLEADIADIASRPQECAVRPGVDFTRTRKIGLAPLMRMLVTMGTGSLSHELMEASGYDPERMPTKSAFCQQRSKLRPSAMRRLLRSFASHLGLSEYRDGWALVAVDGSSFCFGPDYADASTYYPNREDCRGHNSVHAVALCDMVSGHYVDAVVQSGREKDEFSALCELADDFPGWALGGPSPIFVADRGFASYNVFAHIIEAGFHFAIRAKDLNVGRMLRAGGLKELPDEMDRRVGLVLARTRAASRISRPEAAGDYRCVSSRFDFLSEENPEYGIALRIVRFPIGDGRFENIVTNLPEDEFGADEIREIYGMRWSIETSFRRLKLNIGAVEVHSKKAALVTQEIFARLVLYDCCAAMVAHAPAGAAKRGAVHRHIVNFADACRACCAFLRGKARAPDVGKLIAGSTLPVRPGRLFSRRRRLRSPSGYAYRPA